MTDKCAKCDVAFTKDDNTVGCDGCPLWFHSTCTPLGITEAKALNSKKGNLLWMCEVCRYRLQTYGLSKTSAEDTQVISENKKNCEELKNKMDQVSETLMQKMSLLLETQLQQTEILTTITQRPSVIRGKAPNPPTTQHSNSEHNDNNNNGTKPQDQMPEKQVEHHTTQSNGNEEHTWVEVARRPPPRNTGIQGTRPFDTACNLRAADRKAWLFIGRLHPTTDAETLTFHLKDAGIQGEIECEQIETRGRTKAFKIGIPFEDRERATTPEIWPEGILVRRFSFRRPTFEGVRLG